jgi:hypothetical protein
MLVFGKRDVVKNISLFFLALIVYSVDNSWRNLTKPEFDRVVEITKYLLLATALKGCTDRCKMPQSMK